MFDTRTLIICLGMLTLSAAIDPDNICALVSDGTKIVDEDSCAKYYSCKGGKATSQSCSNGQYFSKDSQTCLPKSQVSCKSAADNACEGLDSVFVSAGTCSGYYYCKNGVGTANTCPNDLNFDEKTQKCRYESEYPCSIAGSGSDNPNILCAYIPSGQYFGSPSNCQFWQLCTDNKKTGGKCDDGLIFNVQTGWCDYKGDYDCQQLNGDASDTGGSPLPSCDSTKDTENVKDPDSCSGYLVCVGTTYQVLYCSSGYYFDTDSGKCAIRQKAINDCDRCEGTTLTFVNAYNDDCKGYLICEKGKKVGNGTCATNYYFNEKYGSCIKDSNPEYPACALIPDTPVPTCEDCLTSAIYSSSVKNKCNSPCESDSSCECTCTEACPALPTCTGDSVFDSTANKCNNPDCVNDNSCKYDCCECDGTDDCSTDNTENNSCSAGITATDAVSCLCTMCGPKTGNTCAACLADIYDSSYTEKNNCNSDCGLDCDCTCPGACPALPTCTKDSVFDSPENECNNPTCTDDKSCKYNCCKCDAATDDCSTDNTENNSCSAGITATDVLTCICETCTLKACTADCTDVSIYDSADTNKCNSDCEDTESCDCNCDSCPTTPPCDAGCEADDTEQNNCNPAVTDPAEWVCYCSGC